ncbi:MAG: sulfurtransferase [Burkholderiaceae bacterium]|nr:sulfurtransferase [Burkholderiaceae bacterium]MCD8517398.1 sulfurtransferase [Burkholderiaceae bacterium]MCD8536210.1 sulfurtransferase [Burkholderiaceae bacterium]MCD8564988.1 sulfurtransferase [Burkholderiaceae bacterium]
MTYQNLISVNELRMLMRDHPDALVVLDASHDLFDPDLGRQTYEAGHLPGAKFVSLNSDMGGTKTGKNGRHPLPERGEVVATMRRLGVSDDQQVVVYDQCEGMYATRVWWTLNWLGHRHVAVLDGGLKAWRTAGGELETGVASAVAAGNFSDRGPGMEVVSYEDVLSNVASQERLVVDARAEDRFAGQNETLDPIGGHIPGAINRFYKHNLNADGTFKTPEQLTVEFQAQIGDRRAEYLIMQCGSGVSACHNLFALHMIGLGTAPLYVGSWSEWCVREGSPVATGPA